LTGLNSKGYLELGILPPGNKNTVKKIILDVSSVKSKESNVLYKTD
jgi:hypothetical protein